MLRSIGVITSLYVLLTLMLLLTLHKIILEQPYSQQKCGQIQPATYLRQSSVQHPRA